MSVIVIRDGIIAADTCGTIGGAGFISRKLIKNTDVSIGFTGYWSHGMQFSEWYFKGADMDNLPVFHNAPDKEPDFGALVLKKDSSWEYWTEEFYRDTTMCELNGYMAIGSGRDVALGALYMGATAIEAVKAACANIISCGLPVEHYSEEPVQLVGSGD